MANDKKLSACEIAWISVGSVVLFVLFIMVVLIPLIQRLLLRRKLNRYRNSITPKDTVVLHVFPRMKTIPNVSPFGLKVETYLRLAKLQYTIDSKDPSGPRGTSPWISLNGKHMSDSQVIIDHLGKEFGKDFSQNVSKEQLAVARVVRTMLEEFFNGALLLERFVYYKPQDLDKIIKIPSLAFYYFGRKQRNRLFEQGLAKHPKDDVTAMMTNHLIAVSTIFGDKKYFGNEQICEDDCGIFGILAQVLWAIPDKSPYISLMHGECSNLKEYCLRMKEQLWPDWDKCLAK